MLSDMKDKYPAQNLKDVFVSMNWAKLYNYWEVKTGQWGYSEPVISKRIKAAAMNIQSLWFQKINFDSIQENEIYVIIDGMDCETDEFQLDPSTKWYSHNKNTSK